MAHPIELSTVHRPWPLPSGPWVMFQSWRNLLFTHWPIAPEVLRPLVPSQLELDAFAGKHWLGITPFLLAGLHARGIPPLPFASTFPEINVRTYVRHDGKPGIHFFSLDAGSLLAVIGARATYLLPYHHARASVTEVDGWVRFRTERVGGDAAFEARYRARGDSFVPEPGSLEHFLTERYALYVVRAGRVLRGEIHHPPWRLRAAEAHIARNTMAQAAGIELQQHEPVLHFAERQDTLFWPLTLR